MSKLKVLSIVGMLAVVTAFSGCSLSGGAGEEPDRTAEEVVKEALSKSSSEIETASIDMTMSLNAIPPEEFADQAFDFMFSLNGAVDTSDLEKPLFSLILEASGSGAGVSEQSGKAEVRMDGENIYAMLSDLSDFDGLIPADMVTPYVGKWWKIPVPEDAFSPAALAGLGISGDLKEQEAKIIEIMENVDIFKDIEYEGSEKISGVATWHYTGSLNGPGVVELLSQLSEEFGDYAPSEGEMAELEEILTEITLDVEMWIGQEDNIMRRVKGNLSVSEEVAEGGTIELEFDATYSDINEPVEVEVPEDAEEFDPAALMGGGMMMDDAMFDDAMMDEIDFSDLEMSDEDLAEFEAAMEELDAAMAELEAIE